MIEEQFIPANDLESALVQANKKNMPIREFLSVLLESDVYLLSSTEVNSDGSGFRPMMFDKDGETLISVFTGRERTNKANDRLPYCLTMKGRQLIQRIPAEFGIVLNPQWEVGLEIPPQGLQDIRREFMSST